VPNPGFFKPGNKYGKGRPPKKQIENIRSRILRIVHRRVMHEKDLDTVTTTELLKFLAAIMPKDLGISVQAPQINYISNIPREELPPPSPEPPALEAPVIESTPTTIITTEGVQVDSAVPPL
jgi:hypothetical protein